MISPEFRMTEVLPVIDQYKLYITQNHGMRFSSIMLRGLSVEGFGAGVPAGLLD